MKRLLIATLLLLGGTAWAQTPAADSTGNRPATDTTAVDDDGPNVIGGRAVRPQGELNLIGEPVYYNLEGNVRGSQPRRHSKTYTMPRHHYLNNLSNQHNAFFAELEMLLGRNGIAGGANFTFLPERWGAYASVLGGRRAYVSVGPVLRLSGRESPLDWHLYGGLVASKGFGIEGGLRLAATRRGDHRFCWMSMSVGGMHVDGHGYMTCGISLEVAAITTLSILWW